MSESGKALRKIQNKRLGTASSNAEEESFFLRRSENRRRHARKRCFIQGQARIAAEDHFFCCEIRILNLSASGLLLQCPKPSHNLPAKDAPIKIGFTALDSNQTMEVHGKIVRMEKKPEICIAVNLSTACHDFFAPASSG